MVAIAKPASGGYDPDKFGDGNRPEVGDYHVLITKAEEPAEGKSSTPVTMTILAGDPAGQETKSIDDYYFPFSEKAAPRLLHLFYITGAASLEQIKAGEDLPMSALVGKQLVIHVEHQPARKYMQDGEEKISPASNRVAYNGIFAVTDPDVANVPKNMDALNGALDGDDQAPLDQEQKDVNDAVDENPFGE